MPKDDWHDAGNSIAASLQNVYSNVSTNNSTSTEDLLSTKTTGGIKQLETAAQNTVTTSNYNPYSDEALRAKNGTEDLLTTGEATTSDSEDDDKKWIWPAAPANGVMGLPALVGPDDYGTEMGMIFEQSFPIMTIKPYRMIRADINSVFQRGEFEDVPGGCYKFALQNEGGISLNVNNDFGPSTIESGFRELAENTFGVIGELNQVAQNNRMMGGPIGQGLMKIKNSASDALTNLNDTYMGQLNEIMSKHSESKGVAFGTDAAKAAGNAINMFARALLLGNRIDIPNIWKGSSGGLTATIKIDLRARNVGSFDGSAGDEEYVNQIITPIKILLALACPLRKTSDEAEGGLTYENPPYLDVAIDKTFTSKCCGIKNLSIQADYRDTNYYKSRPTHFVVTMQIQDLYEVFVWDNKATNNEAPAVGDDVPSSAMFINRLMENENGQGLPASLLELTQSGISGNNGSKFGSASSFFNFGSITSSLMGSLTAPLSTLTTSITSTLGDVTESLFTPISASLGSAFGNTVSQVTSNYIYSTVNSATNQGLNYLNNKISSFISQGDAVINQAFGSFSNGATTHIASTFMNNLVIGNNTANSSAYSKEDTTMPYFNGKSSEINTSTPQIIKNVYTKAVEMEDSESSTETTDPVEQVDKAANMVYTQYDK